MAAIGSDWANKACRQEPMEDPTARSGRCLPGCNQRLNARSRCPRINHLGPPEAPISPSIRWGCQPSEASRSAAAHPTRTSSARTFSKPRTDRAQGPRARLKCSPNPVSQQSPSSQVFLKEAQVRFGGGDAVFPLAETMPFIIEQHVLDGHLIGPHRSHQLITFDLQYPGIIGALHH